MSRCTVCKEPVTWATLDGRRVPFESVGEAKNGNYVMLPRDNAGPVAFPTADRDGYWNRHVHVRKVQKEYVGSSYGRGRK